MKIAVTGASGFIGREILKELKEREHVVIHALTRRKTEEDETNLFWKETDYSTDSLTEAMKGCDAVIHLAAIRGTTGSIADYHENEILTERVLLAMKQAEVKRIVFASSIAVYSDTASIPWTDTQALTPKTLYGITKASCEYLCEYYCRLHNSHYTILRIAQVLGAGEKRKGMMNVFLDTAKAKGKIKVIGKSEAKRQYIYVKDLAKVFAEAALETNEQDAVYPVGMKDAFTNLEIARYVNAVLDNETPILYEDAFPETIEPSCMEVSKTEEHFHITFRNMEQALEDFRD